MTPENTEDEKDAGRRDGADGVTRREFLEILGASFAALSMAGCKLRPPKEKVLPYLIQPEEAAAGQAVWYSSTCGSCPAACGVLIKNRDGRPIKLEGNPDHPLSRGGLCARGQASVLDLYDSERLRGPLESGRPASWSQADSAIAGALAEAKAIRVVSRTVNSPSLEAALGEFLRRYPAAKRVAYEPVSSWAIVEAHRRTHGLSVLPHYRLDRARAIVSFGADFLGTWISPVEFARDWSSNRKREEGKGVKSWVAQFESRMSLTGANADLRVSLKPSEELAAAIALGRMVAGGLNWPGQVPPHLDAPGADLSALETAAGYLRDAGKHGLVLSGSTDPAVQTVVNWINESLGAYGTTVDVDNPSRQALGDDAAMSALIDELGRGEADAVVVLEANPAYDHPRAKEFAAALKTIPLSVALSDRLDETASACRFALPAAHFLEAWGDAQPDAATASLFQPAIAPLFDSRPAIESLLAWAGKPQSAYDFVREEWRTRFFPRSKGLGSFNAFWEEAVRRGAVSLPKAAAKRHAFDASVLPGVAASRSAAKAGDFELAAFAGVALADGRQANNPWLQELPDPVTRVSWGNCASFSPKDAARLGLEEGRVVALSAGGVEALLPAHIQPGQESGVVAAALGYGRRDAGKIAANYPMVKMLPIEKDLLAGADLFPLLAAQTVAVKATGRTSALAKVQIYDFLADPVTGRARPLVGAAAVEEYKKEAAPAPEEGRGLWPKHEYAGHKWGMAIDLNACTGCAGCVVACQAENNVPVVGKAEMRKGRDMAWLRIDRYYDQESSDVSFEPMLCQHCDNAPCETVCPVLATVHSSEGLNMQVYNRCVGTRYCANNCPYKVRRFNWFDYAHQDLVQNLALNPDVTVRSRGVMEKCSFCVQRLYSAKFQAKQEGRELKDGDAVPACAQSCPAQAIVFGDLNDPESKVSKLSKRNDNFRVLAEIGTGPSVFYIAREGDKRI